MPVRSQRAAHWSPRLTAVGIALIGLVNIGSALTPNIRWRGHLLLHVEPVQTMRFFHALALPAGAALLLVAPYLAKRRHRAWQAAVVLMIALGVFDLFKGLDFEETAISWAAAAALIAGRSGYQVRHDPITLRSAIWRVPALALAGMVAATVATWASQGRPALGKVLNESGALLRWHHGPIAFEHHMVLHHRVAWIPLGVHLLQIGTLLGIAYLIFRPLAGPRSLPSPDVRKLAQDLVQAHGRDTLSFFKLRPDKHYFFSEDRRAFVGYKIENGVLLLSGDPVGPDETYRELLSQLREFANVRGLKLGAVGASERMLGLYEELGLKTIYLGDEAVIEFDKFSLEGRAIRKVRQSVSRLTKAGFTAELTKLRDLTPATVDEIEVVLEKGRNGAPERGFSMAMDSIRGQCENDTLLVLARDDEHRIKGVLHFVPCYGRSAVSLSFMRRDPDTPNGLTEFLVVEAVELLRQHGLDEMSLNFATAARFMHSPEKRSELLIGKLAAKLNKYFQIESLYRFNAKFFPRWEPRYFVYEGRLGLFRTALAAMWAEGQLPKLTLPRRTGARAGEAPASPPTQVAIS